MGRIESPVVRVIEGEFLGLREKVGEGLSNLGDCRECRVEHGEGCKLVLQLVLNLIFNLICFHNCKD